MRASVLKAMLVVTVVVSCARPLREQPGHEAATPELAYRLAAEIAAAASTLDVDALLRLIPRTERVVYVSNGYPISGNDYRSEMGDFYRSLKSLDWKWDRWEAQPISNDVLLFTGWATVTAVPLVGERRTERAIYTFVFARHGDGWKRVIGHKTKLAED